MAWETAAAAAAPVAGGSRRARRSEGWGLSWRVALRSLLESDIVAGTLWPSLYRWGGTPGNWRCSYLRPQHLRSLFRHRNEISASTLTDPRDRLDAGEKEAGRDARSCSAQAQSCTAQAHMDPTCRTSTSFPVHTYFSMPIPPTWFGYEINEVRPSSTCGYHPNGTPHGQSMTIQFGSPIFRITFSLTPRRLVHIIPHTAPNTLASF